MKVLISSILVVNEVDSVGLFDWLDLDDKSC